MSAAILCYQKDLFFNRLELLARYIGSYSFNLYTLAFFKEESLQIKTKVPIATYATICDIKILHGTQ